MIKVPKAIANEATRYHKGLLKYPKITNSCGEATNTAAGITPPINRVRINHKIEYLTQKGIENEKILDKMISLMENKCIY